MLVSLASMQRFSIPLLVAIIASAYGPIPVDAKTVVARAGWKETSALLAQPDYRPALQIQLKSSKKMKGTVSGTTTAGLRLKRKGAETFIERTQIHSIKLVPRKASGHRNRILALVGGVPAGLGAGLGVWRIGCAVAGGCGEPPNPIGAAGFYAVLVAVPVLVYRFAARADRGALLIILDESAPNISMADPAHSSLGHRVPWR